MCKEAASAPAGGHGHVVLWAAELKKPVSWDITGGLHWIFWYLIRCKCWSVFPSVGIHNISFPGGSSLSNKGHVHIAAFTSTGALIGFFSSRQLPIFIKRIGIQYLGDLLLFVKFFWNRSTGSKVTGKGEVQLSANKTGEETWEWYCMHDLFGILN